MDINIKYHKLKDPYTIKKSKIGSWINIKHGTKRSNDVRIIDGRKTEKKSKMMIKVKKE